MFSLYNINFFQLLREALRQHFIDSWLEDHSRILLKSKPNAKRLNFSEKMRKIMGLQDRSVLQNPTIIRVNGFNVNRF
jgi:hypothetical protein